METRTQIFLDAPGVSGRPIVDKVERTSVGPNGGIAEAIEIRLTIANGCGHVLHTAAEATARCANPDCGAILCKDCTASRDHICAMCARPVCTSCTRRIWLRADDSVVCLPCARRWWRRELVLAGMVAGAVLLALAALFR